MRDQKPIAIIGMGCRYAGANSLAEFWQLLIDGRCGMRPIPPDRFPIDQYHDPKPGAKNRIVTREGGYLDDLRGFDAQLFGISYREAASMDPQQRILLEVAWSALQDAGLPLDTIDGARAGIFVGLFTGDYRDRIIKRGGGDPDVYTEIGTTRSSTAGRLAHAFNLNGPTMAVDAACASSLAAVHLACQSIWLGESTFALAAGTNVILEPDGTICFSRSGMLSPESRCKFGDANASGFVRSEGVGVAVLKPLEQALVDKDRVYAIIRAAECTNDARQGQGLFMTPSQEGQMTLLRRAYEEHDLSIDRLCYIEAHGTGTRAGDPVECSAVAKILGARRQDEHPLYTGSVKSNIGHPEGAAGIAGVIKTALLLHHRTIPPSLHFETPNPNIPWEEGRLQVPIESQSLHDRGPALLAGVSSFGLSGTNAHVVLESFDSPPAADKPDRDDAFILPLSAHRPSALRELAVSYHGLLSQAEDDSPELAAVCYTAARRRTHLGHRLAVVGKSRQELIEALLPFMETEPDDQAAAAPCNRVVFVFPGQGGQWIGMGRALAECEPSFRRTLEQIDHVVMQQEGWSVIETLNDESGQWMQDISRIQPLLAVIQIAIARLWQDNGVKPDAVVGHSLGEVAAAHIAGALSLDDAMRVICTRSRCLAKIQGQGKMAVVGLDLREAAEVIRGYEDRLAIAVSNGRASTVLSGDPVALEEVLGPLEAKGIFCRKVDVDVASHSPQTEPLLGELREQLAVCQPQTGTIPFYSTVYSEIRPGTELGADYWAANMRQAVRFADTTQLLLRNDHDIFIEVGPHPVLLNPILQMIREEKAPAIAVGSMSRDEQDRLAFLNAVGSVYMFGYPVNWSANYPAGKLISLPEYPFQHEEFWIEENDELSGSGGLSSRQTASGKQAHPMLPRYFELGSVADTSIWEVPLSTRLFPYLEDHCVRGSALLPGAAYVEIALAAAAEMFDGRACELENIEFRDYLAVPTDRTRILQIQMQRQYNDRAELRFYSFEDGPTSQKPARLHAVARLRLEKKSTEFDLAVDELTDSEHGVYSPARLLEQFDVELERRHHNPSYRFGVLSIFVGTPGDSKPDTALLPKLMQRVREHIRDEDFVHAAGPQQLLVLLKDVARADDPGTVASRLYRYLSEPESEASGAPGCPIMIMGGQVDSQESDAATALRDTLIGCLVPLAAGESTQFGGETTFSPPDSLTPAYFYKMMEARGIHYGPLFRPLQNVERMHRAAQGILEIPEGIQEEMGEYLLHPAILDGCFQAAAAAFIDELDDVAPSDTFLPMGIRRLTLRRPPAGRLHCRTWLRGQIDGRPDEIEVDFVISDDEHNTVVQVDGFRMRRFQRRFQILTGDLFDTWFHQWQWQLPEETDPPTHLEELSRWLILEEQSGLAKQLAAEIEALGQTCTCVTLPITPEDLGAELEKSGAGENPGPDGVLYLAAPSSLPTDGSGEVFADLCANRCMDVVELVRQLARTKDSQPLPLWLATAGVWTVKDDEMNPNLLQAPIWGLGRVISNELPEIALRMIDMPYNWGESEIPLLLNQLLHPDAEDEIALRDGKRHVHRLQQTPVHKNSPRRIKRQLTGEEPYAIVWDGQGESKTPVLQLTKRQEPESEEIEIRVHAAALEQTGGSSVTGVGCAGIICASGEAVSDLKTGDRVMALMPQSPTFKGSQVCRYVTVPRGLVAAIPSNLSFEDAAIIPALYLPACLALSRLGQLSEGERVLIRSASRGLGQAAVAIAQECGAIVYASAPTLEGREHLRQQKLPYVLDEWSPELTSQINDLTGGEGVDLVINTLEHGGAELGLSLLGSGGRLVDLTPPESRREDNLHMARAKRCFSYSALDLSELSNRRPSLVGKTLESLTNLIGQGRLRSDLPRIRIAPDHLEAVNQIGSQQKEQATKILVMETEQLTVTQQLTKEALFESDASYLITGGTGALGMLLARWMAERNAGQIILLSRGGQIPEDQIENVAAIRERGTDVTVLRGDVSDQNSLQGVFKQIADDSPPLRGVFHLAGILDDASLERQTHTHFIAAMRPKVMGAWNLHQLTEKSELRHFVMFSSAATTIGSPGQANYSAANAFMDALANYRRCADLPALSINWGVWAEVGLAAAQENRAARLESRGLSSMAPGDGLRALGRLLLHADLAEIATFAMDWNRWARTYPHASRSPSVSHLLSEPETTGEDGTQQDFMTRFNEAQTDARRPLLLDYLRQQIAEVLRLPPSRLSLNQPLAQLGMDSLMTVELRGWLKDGLQVELSPRLILEMPDLGAMADVILAEMSSGDSPSNLKEAQTLVSEGNEFTKVKLDEAIQADSPAATATNPQVVFLTGATGFVGAHILRELLDSTGARIDCLVRAEDKAGARQRIQETMDSYGLLNGDDSARISPVVGDLAKPLLGLSPERFQALGSDTEVIYHCGAWVNHALPYSHLEATNVQGTQEVLRLAITGQPKCVHHVSSVAVFPFTDDPQADFTFTENTPLQDRCEQFFGGYAESKWAAEQLAFQARERGLNVNIYRAGLIAGSTITGICPSSDAIWRFVQAIVALGIAPRFSRGLGLTPVDFLSRGLVQLSLKAETSNQAFHLFNRRHLQVEDLLICLKRLGHEIPTVELNEWKEQVAEQADRSLAIYPILPKILELDFVALDGMRASCDCRETMSKLDEDVREHLKVSQDLLTRYLEGLTNEGFFEIGQLDKELVESGKPAA